MFDLLFLINYEAKVKGDSGKIWEKSGKTCELFKKIAIGYLT
jgi:hypothetical protein